MNRQRRTEIRKAINLILEAKDILENVLADEQEAFDNLPEGFQCSERGETMEENISLLEDFIEYLDTDELEEI